MWLFAWFCLLEAFALEGLNKYDVIDAQTVSLFPLIQVGSRVLLTS